MNVEAATSVRVIEDQGLTRPQVPLGDLTRLPPKETAADRNAREREKLAAIMRARPLDLVRPVVVSAGLLRSAGREVALAGIYAPALEATCTIADTEWKCGRFARGALQRLIRARTVNCVSGQADEAALRCSVSGIDLSAWLVENGWARAEDQALMKLQRFAQESGKGLWRKTVPGQ